MRRMNKSLVAGYNVSRATERNGHSHGQESSFNVVRAFASRAIDFLIAIRDPCSFGSIKVGRADTLHAETTRAVDNHRTRS